MADPALLDRLAAEVDGAVRGGEHLAAHTTLRVGGPAAAFVVAESPADLAAVARVCRELERPWLVIGRGSNLLVAQSGWPGVAVTLGRSFRGVDLDPSDSVAIGGEVAVEAGAAEPMPVLARTLAAQGLSGMAFGIAIPGTLGGAVRMNAGAHGREIADVLEWAEVARLDAGGGLERWPVERLEAAYRRTALPAGAVVVRSRLRLTRAEAAEVAGEMDEMRRWRRAHQPINQPSCGSVFRNPPGDSAGRLIEAAGLKGCRLGGAQVSPRHANFITTEPGTDANDVAGLIRHVRDVVAAEQGVELHTEVVLVGFDEVR